MSQRFTVSKSDGEGRPSDIQGEVNQLFEGDEPQTSSTSGGGAEGQTAAAAEVVVVLKGRQLNASGEDARLLSVGRCEWLECLIYTFRQ